MNLESFTQELETYVRAKYPLIYLVTQEESRGVELLTRLAGRLQTDIFFWSCTKGFVHIREQAGVIRDQENTKPMDALEYIQRSPNKGLYILLDFHPFLEDPKVIRKMRDTIFNTAESAKSLFILSPKKVVPVECEKEFVVTFLPTPDPVEITQILQQSLSALKGRIQVDLTEQELLQLVEAFRGLPSTEIVNVLSRMVVRDGKLDADDLRDVVCEKGRMISASGLLQFHPPNVSLDSVGGLDALKEWLNRKKLAFTQQARDYGLDTPKGVLLVGVPGCGKSLTAKAVSTLWQMPLLRLDIGQLFSSYIGSSEENMRKAISTAESIAPCILWIDEIEKGMSGMQGNDSADGGVARRIFATLLTWMQDKKEPVFMVATANDVSALPPEFLRKGRFDDIFFIDLPSEVERQTILAIHLSKRKRNPAGFDLATLANKTNGYSGADLESIVSEALENSYVMGRDVTQQDLEMAIAGCVPLAATMSEKIAEVRNWAVGRARRAN